MRLSLPAPPRTVRATSAATANAPTCAASASASVPPPPDALAEGAAVEVRRGDRGGWHPAVVRRIIATGVFRVRVAYDAVPVGGAAAEWIVFDPAPRGRDGEADGKGEGEPRPEPRPESCIPSPRRAPLTDWFGRGAVRSAALGALASASRNFGGGGDGPDARGGAHLALARVGPGEDGVRERGARGRVGRGRAAGARGGRQPRAGSGSRRVEGRRSRMVVRDDGKITRACARRIAVSKTRRGTTTATARRRRR